MLNALYSIQEPTASILKKPLRRFRLTVIIFYVDRIAKKQYLGTDFDAYGECRKTMVSLATLIITTTHHEHHHHEHNMNIHMLIHMRTKSTHMHT